MVSKAKTSVTFHSGILTIGGTVIEVAYEDAHIFFDFGTEFRPELSLPDETLPTLLEYRLVPHLQHVYDARLLKLPDTKNPFTKTAVFLSHVHLDHTKMINYLDPKIPLYTSESSKKILELLNKKGTFLLNNPYLGEKTLREITGVPMNTTIEVGKIKVELLPVDHDAYGACGFIITTPTARLAYTGDLRLHGYLKEETLAFCKKAKHTDCLMMEGVSVSWPELEEKDEEKEASKNQKRTGACQSEAELLEKIEQLVAENPKRTIVFNGYPANPLRFLHLSEKVPRKVVLTAEMAALIKEIFGKDEYYYCKNGEDSPLTLEKSFEIPYDKLLEEPEKYFWQITEAFDDLPKHALYIHSDAEPLGDFDPAYGKFLQHLEDLGVEFCRLSCSGHAVPDDLNRIIAAIEPKLLVPIHTLHPERLENPYGKRILPQRGQKILF